MLSIIMTLILTFILPGPAQAQSNKLSTKLYESEPEVKTEKFTSKVKVIRDDGDGVEVFFISEKQKGAYVLSRSAANYAEILKVLENSRKPKGPPVSVTANGEKHIKSVEKAAAPEGGFKIPDDPNEKWDFGKVPD